jgi:hypothetical protein
MTPAETDPGFAEWCERMALGRVRRRLRLGLPISAIGWRTLRRFDPALRAARLARPAVTPELVHVTVDQAIDVNAAYDALATLLVRHYRTRLSPAVA